MSATATKTFLVVGAGFTGATLANKLAALGHKVLVIDKREHIGGNCYDYVDSLTGIRISKYGPHFFHTNDEEVWEYVNRFSAWTPFYNKVLAQVGDKYVPVPVNAETINTLFNTALQTPEEVRAYLAQKQIQPLTSSPQNSEEVALQRVGQELYDLLFKPYTIKQWAKDPKDLESLVLARIPVRDNWDNRYFSDRFQALPTNGYTAVFEKMLDHPNIEVRLGVSHEDLPTTEAFDEIIFTGRIDAYFKAAGLPELEYRSLDFHINRFYNTPGFVQRNATINTPSADIPYTRGIEYKYYPGACVGEGSTSNSVVIYETSCDCTGGNDPYYPVPSAANQALYERYKALAAAEKNVHFIGRLASYKYFNMDQAIRAALDYFKEHFDEPSVIN